MLSPVRLDVDALSTAWPWPISKDLVEQHLRLDASDQDDLLKSFVLAAAEWAEGDTHRTIFKRDVRWVLREFPYDGRMEIQLPRGKTNSVASIQYSVNGSMVTMRGPSSGSPTGTDFQEDLRGDGGAILMPARGGSWPSADCDVPAPVVITFSAGWVPAEVPMDIVHAMLFAVSDAFDIRSTSDFDASTLSATGPRFAVRSALISPYRMSRVY